MKICVSNPLHLLSPTFSVVTLTALADSINPCALSVLLIILISLTESKQKKRILFSGLIYILVIYFVYLLLGFGIISGMKFVNYSIYFHVFVAILAFGVGAKELKDFIWPPKKLFCTRTGVCSGNKFEARLIEKATSFWGMLITALAISVFILPCSSGPYFWACAYLSKGFTWLKITPILLYYNLIFILPMLVILILVYYGFSTIEKTRHWKEKNMRWVNLIDGLLMIGLGIWTILS